MENRLHNNLFINGTRSMKIKKYYLELITLALFLILLPLSLKVNFIQNDDWNRTLTTLEFIKGNFTLRPETANTFYLQGLLGMFFSLVTGSTKFPILTLVFSVLNFYIFAKIISKFFTQDKLSVLTLSFLFFLNPFHVYSIWGFMAENFYLFFTLLSVYFFLTATNSLKLKWLIASNIGVALGFFVKQVSIVTGIAYLCYLVASRKWKYALIQLVFTLGIILYYYFLFPRTEEMNVKDITLDKFKDLKFVFSLGWANLVYTAALSIPLVFLLVIKKITLRKTIILALSVVACLLLVNKYFNPNRIGPGEFPFIQNTFTRFGYYTMNIHGTAYQYRFIYDIFTNWQLVATLLAGLIPGIFIYYIRKQNNVFFYFFGGYMMLMLLISEMFDRYLLPAFPMFIFLALTLITPYKKIYNLFVLPFVLFLGILNYQYSMNFVLSNNYMFAKADELVKTEGITYSQISINRAWRKIHTGKSKVYTFSYDSPEIGNLEEKDYKMVLRHEVTFPFNLHINPYIYLYRNDANAKE